MLTYIYILLCYITIYQKVPDYISDAEILVMMIMVWYKNEEEEEEATTAQRTFC